MAKGFAVIAHKRSAVRVRLAPPNGTRTSSPLRVEETEAVATGAFTGALIVETACPSRFPPVFKTSEVWQPQAG